VLENVLGLCGDLGLNLQVFGIEAPQFVAAAPLVFRSFILLYGADEIINFFVFIFVEELRVAQEFAEVFR